MPDTPERPTEDGIHRESLGTSRGRYVLRTGTHEAELTYSVASSQLIVADHVGVPDALGGRGIGKRLVARMVTDARSEGVKVVPLCPFVAAMKRRYPDWADVFSD